MYIGKHYRIIEILKKTVINKNIFYGHLYYDVPAKYICRETVKKTAKDAKIKVML